MKSIGWSTKHIYVHIVLWNAAYTQITETCII